jgi:hypothetical protein
MRVRRSQSSSRNEVSYKAAQKPQTGLLIFELFVLLGG